MTTDAADVYTFPVSFETPTVSLIYSKVWKSLVNDRGKVKVCKKGGKCCLSSFFRQQPNAGLSQNNWKSKWFLTARNATGLSRIFKND